MFSNLFIKVFRTNWIQIEHFRYKKVPTLKRTIKVNFYKFITILNFIHTLSLAQRLSALSKLLKLTSPSHRRTTHSTKDWAGPKIAWKLNWLSVGQWRQASRQERLWKEKNLYVMVKRTWIFYLFTLWTKYVIYISD